MLRSKELKSLPSNIAIDTGSLILPITREPGWCKIRKLLHMHEEGEVMPHIGLFNISEIVYAMMLKYTYRLFYLRFKFVWRELKAGKLRDIASILMKEASLVLAEVFKEVI